MKEIKKKLRSQLLEQRVTFTPEFITEKSRIIADKLSFLYHFHGVIGGYAPIRGEVDALAIMALLAPNTMALPCIVPNQKILTFRQWQTLDPLVDGPYGVRCPTNSATTVLPDVLLVPLVAFDHRNYRLGYGGGYYDATIPMLRSQKPTLQTIGLAYDFQQIDSIPVEPHDISLDMVVTDS